MTTSRTESVPTRTTLLRPREAAELLAISPRLLWSLTQQGAVRAVRFGRTVRYDLTDLLAWIERQKGPRTSNRAM
ncbi:MAG: helix-turn-helix domain-containing protein [Planctomycetes bacterium]|nr:helix-turn-helix domain-containing protein [Planctomycetota bacterium]